MVIVERASMFIFMVVAHHMWVSWIYRSLEDLGIQSPHGSTCFLHSRMVFSYKYGYPKTDDLLWGNPTRMDDLGVLLFQETTKNWDFNDCIDPAQMCAALAGFTLAKRLPSNVQKFVHPWLDVERIGPSPATYTYIYIYIHIYIYIYVYICVYTR